MKENTLQWSAMVGITTGQEMANVIPAIQLGVQHYLAVKTPFAQKNAWGVGTVKVLENRAIHCDQVVLSREEVLSVEHIAARIREALYRKHLWDRSLLWNIGGGQKPQQLAMWYLYTNRVMDGVGSSDRLVYADPDKGLLTMFSFGRTGKIEQTVIPLRSPLGIQEIIKVNLDERMLLEMNKPPCHLPPETAIQGAWNIVRKLSKIPDYYTSGLPFTPGNEPWVYYIQRVAESLEKWVMKNAGRFLTQGLGFFFPNMQSQIEETLSSLDKGSNSDLIRRLQDLYKECIASAETHEKIHTMYDNQTFMSESIGRAVQKLVTNCISQKIGTSNELPEEPQYNHNVYIPVRTTPEQFEYALSIIVSNYIARLNREFNADLFVECVPDVVIKNQSAGTDAGQHDILVATSSGILISIDAKTGTKADEEKRTSKDWVARLHRIRDAGGYFSQWVPVFPPVSDPKRQKTIIQARENTPEVTVLVVEPSGKDLITMHKDEGYTNIETLWHYMHTMAKNLSGV